MKFQLTENCQIKQDESNNLLPQLRKKPNRKNDLTINWSCDEFGNRQNIHTHKDTKTLVQIQTYKHKNTYRKTSSEAYKTPTINTHKQTNIHQHAHTNIHVQTTLLMINWFFREKR